MMINLIMETLFFGNHKLKYNNCWLIWHTFTVKCNDDKRSVTMGGKDRRKILLCYIIVTVTHRMMLYAET